MLFGDTVQVHSLALASLVTYVISTFPLYGENLIGAYMGSRLISMISYTISLKLKRNLNLE